MLELRRTKEVGPEGGRKKVGCYTNVSDIVEAMENCLDSIAEIRNLIQGLKLEAFIEDREVLDRCAIDFQMIGDRIGRLDPKLQFNEAMETAYDSRSIIAHRYGERTFRKDLFFENIKAGLDYLEDGCLRVIDTVTSQDVVFSANVKNSRVLGRRSG